ncbi:TPA: DUF3800 domain-containing protein [Vibrio cholerae]
MTNEVFDTVDKNYTLFYDESNNVRVLSLYNDQYNIDKDKNQTASVNFILAGIAHRNNRVESDPENLVKKLKLQPTAQELKFNQVAKGNFEKVLCSSKIQMVLEWLLESDFYIHYFNLNMEYWAFIDIIDDAFSYLTEIRALKSNNLISPRYYLDYHKDALYKLIRLDKSKFLSLMSKFNYPNLKSGFEKKLIREINKLLKENLRYSSILQTNISKETQMAFKSLSEMFDLCKNIPSLELTYNSNKDLLIDGFSVFYNDRSTKFKHSQHIFDDENTIEDEFNKLLVHDKKLSELDYKFIDSKDSVHVQLSDVVAGLFNKYFTFIEQNSLEDIIEIKNNFNSLQKKNVELLKELINKSDSECPHFLFYVMTMSEHDKHCKFMFD